MKKIVKKWGDSLIITFDKEDCNIFGISEGSIIDFDDIVVTDNIVNNKQKQADRNITKICEDMKDDN